MTTYTTYASDSSTITTKAGTTSAPSPRHVVFWNDIDFANRNVTAADVVEALAIPANTYIQHVAVHVLTADASQTMSVGDGDDTDGWLAGATTAAVGDVACSTIALTNGTNETITGYSGGKFYSAADTIDILVPTGKAYDTLKVRIFAAGIRFT